MVKISYLKMVLENQFDLHFRLPLFQGPAASYIVPLLALNEIDPDRCNVEVVCK